VLGAGMAYAGEIRAMGLTLIRGVITREHAKIDREEQSAARFARKAALYGAIRRCLLVMGYEGRIAPVEPLRTKYGTVWRRRAPLVWKAPYEITASSTVWVPEGTGPRRLLRAVIRACGRLLESEPLCNRAVLRHRVYSRSGAQVMVHAQIAPDEMRHPILEPAGLSDAALRHKLDSAIVDARERALHPLAPFGDALLDQWIEDGGFIVSPAGASISGGGALGESNGLDDPHGALAGVNGIPLSVGVGRIQRGHAKLVIRMDHRAFDAEHGTLVHQWLRRHVPRLCVD
jgi:hypothetical protein